MFSVITTASHREVEAAMGTGLGNRYVPLNIRVSRDEPGAIIVEVPDWAGSLLTAGLRRINAWFDRVQVQGRIPRGQPIVAHAGASSVRNQQRKVNATTRKDRAVRRAMKAA